MEEMKEKMLGNKCVMWEYVCKRPYLDHGMEEFFVTFRKLE